MGRGIAYKYEHFLLYDDSEFILSCGGIENCVRVEDKDIEKCDGECYGEFDEQGFRYFKEEILKAFDASPVSKDSYHNFGLRDSYIFGETTYSLIGIAYSGDSPCIFSVSRLSEDEYEESEEEEAFEIIEGHQAETTEAFRKIIIGDYAGMYRVATSAWTSRKAEEADYLPPPPPPKQFCFSDWLEAGNAVVEEATKI